MRVADYISKLLIEHGVRHVFMVTGGGAMHLNDALARDRAHLAPVCFHHEQACAIAAESYARLSGRLAAVNVTTGPGGINALNGVFGAWTDSIGMIVISGQVKRETMIGSYDLPLRQLGDQEVDIIALVKPITKYAVVLREPKDVRYVMEKALWLAKNGRPGPVWIDVPIDVQGAPVNESELRGFDPAKENAALPAEANPLSGKALDKPVAQLLEKLKTAKRPVILAGAGVRLSGAHAKFMEVIEQLGIPVTTGWNAHDTLHNAHPLYAGRPGTVGDRGGNFAVQNSDFLLVLGSRLNIRQISYNWKAFARHAYKVMVDIDKAEMNKPTLSVDLKIHAALKDFLPALSSALAGYKTPKEHSDYLAWCRERVARYPVVLPEYYTQSLPINPYCFMKELFEQLEEGDIIVTADGTACVVSFQAGEIKPGQRLYHNSGCASMGYDLPGAIGAHYASGKRIICLAGDGSMMMNIQELQTIAGNKLPIKLFILNNDGYASIRQTQQNYFSDNIIGCGPESGVTFPDFVKLCNAMNIPASRTESHDDMKSAIRKTLDGQGPQALEVMLDPKQTFSPKLSSRKLDDGRMISAPLEDLFPFLSREELAENLLIPAYRE